MTALSGMVVGEATAGILFLGLALTFGLITVLPSTESNKSWALIPAGILGLTGILLTASALDIYKFIWPVIFILLGGYFIVRTLLPKKT
jgi:hypothetical protein